MEAQRLRWALWLPVAFAAGIGAYFSLYDEPPVEWTLVPAVAALAVAWRLRRTRAAMPATVLLVTALGFLAADLRSERIAAPVLAKRTGLTEVTGRIVRRSAGDDGTRILLAVEAIASLPDAETPARVRLTWRGTWPLGVNAGDRVRVRAVLRPLPGQVAPGAFDFARYAWFRRIGALGFTVAPPELLPSSRAGGPGERFRRGLERLRHGLARRFENAMPETQAAVATALATGERGGIPEADLQSLRDSGLAHLLAISGLHMMLVGGLAFWVLRSLLTISERIALTQPVVKWAALTAIPVAAGYLAISGAPISAQRAFLMFSLMMIAVMIGRPALSMRIVALTAFIVLVLAPESLLEAGFQMSFAAVVALIAAYEAQGNRLTYYRSSGGWLDRSLDRIWRTVAAIAVTTLIASTATAPFAAYHFQHAAFYALPANLVAVPLFTILVMPFGLLGVALMPLGLEAWPLAVMAYGIDGILSIARAISEWPGATANLAAMPPAFPVLTALGGLWLCIWSGPVRWLGTVPMIAALASALSAQRPDILIDEKGSLIAFRDRQSNRLVLSRTHPGFVAGAWLERDGDSRAVRDAASDVPEGWRCDELGCVLQRGGRPWLAHVRKARALDEDCGRVRILVSAEPVRGPCEGPGLVIGRFDLWRKGAHAIWLKPDGSGIRRVETTASLRPWSPYRTRLLRARGGSRRSHGRR